MKYARFDMGQTEALINKLGGLPNVMALLSGSATYEIGKHIVDLDAKPYNPFQGKVLSHVRGRKFEWEPSQVAFQIPRYIPYTEPGHEWKRPDLSCGEFLVQLEGKRLANANLLDYLLDHPLLIPDEWSEGSDTRIFFLGTTYDSGNGSPVLAHARGLVFKYGHWQECRHQLVTPPSRVLIMV